MLTDDELFDWIGEDTAFLADISAGHLDEPVTSCPEWTIRDLVAHVGGAQSGWYPYNLERQDIANPDPIAAFSAAPEPPIGDDPAMIQYLRDATATILDVGRRIDLETPVWAFGPTAPARYWILRAVTELSVHVWDGASSLGVPYRLSPERAAVSIDETVRGMWTLKSVVVSELPTPPSEPLSIVATDSGARWVLHTDSAGNVVVNPPDVAPDTTISGDGMDLVLWIWGRIPTADLNVTGDTAVADGWNLFQVMQAF